MEYQELKDVLLPFFEGKSGDIAAAEAILAKMKPGDICDKRILFLLRNIIANAKIGACLNSVGMSILKNSDYFSDSNINKKEKNSKLDNILTDGAYSENDKLFNLSMFRTYLENILDKQLYEINLKIEENQRLLQTVQASLPPK